jgi:hypothetical protein
MQICYYDENNQEVLENIHLHNRKVVNMQHKLEASQTGYCTCFVKRVSVEQLSLFPYKCHRTCNGSKCRGTQT